MEEVTGGWSKMHNSVHGFYSTTNIIKVIIPRRIKLAGHEPCSGRTEMHTRFLW
jgi:hypothetical protein